MAKAIISDSVVTRRKLSVMLVALLSLCISVQAEANFTVWVIRRSTQDLYSLNSNSTVTVDNCGAKPNYLVNEKQCASDEELFSGCRIAIVPTNSIFLIPTAISIDGQYSAIITLDDSFKKHVLIFGFNGTNHSVNSSFCSISSLEVYRGRQQAIEISHQGFSLGDNGSIEIHNGHHLAYGTDDYTGELYRMNLSCSGGGLPESGCLFFKVAGSTSTIINKFNNTVLGTCTLTVSDIINAATVTDTFSDSETMSTKIMTTFTTTTVTLSPDAVYIAVGGVLFFLIVMVVLGVVAGLLVRRVKHNVVTKQLSDMTSKSSKQGPSGTSNFKLESPTQEATPLEEMVTEFKEVELDGEYRPCLTRQSASLTSKPVPTHHDQDTTVSAQGSTEQLYVCPILSNVCESETANQY